MKVLPTSLQSVIDAIEVLPGVGPRSAERFAYYLLRANPEKANVLARALVDLHGDVTYCPVTFALIDRKDKVSSLYSHPTRDKQKIMIVEDPFDIVAIEKTGVYSGTYHVLGGLISPIDGVGPDDLHLNELRDRIASDQVSEIILGTNASVEGESTSLYLSKLIQELSAPVQITRLAQGLPIGLDLEYADQITLSRAFEGRREVS